MTRETKIGLLVGLAFIILIGILLSDHLSVTAEPPQAALAQAGENVREGIITPGTVATIQPAAPEQIAPTQPILTREELHAPRTPETVVSVLPASPVQNEPPVSIRYYSQQTSADQQTPRTQYQIVTPEQVVGITPPARSTPVAQVELPRQPPVEVPYVTQLPPELQRLAQHEELVVVDRSGRPVADDRATTASHRAPVQAREYVAQPGDTLSKMAARFYGRSTPETQATIVRANPSLKDNPNLIVAGRTYLIPQETVTATPQPAAAQPKPQPHQAEVRTTSDHTYLYTAKPGDSLWKIANEQLGDPRLVSTIQKMNQDVLKGPNKDIVYVGMTLRLPAKPVAVAN